jgi:hypothetical protein
MSTSEPQIMVVLFRWVLIQNSDEIDDRRKPTFLPACGWQALFNNEENYATYFILKDSFTYYIRKYIETLTIQIINGINVAFL